MPRSGRYQLTETGLAQALLFTHAHDHLLRTGLAHANDPGPRSPAVEPSRLLNRGEPVGDGSGVAGQAGRGRVDLLDQ